MVSLAFSSMPALFLIFRGRGPQKYQSLGETLCFPSRYGLRGNIHREDSLGYRWRGDFESSKSAKIRNDVARGNACHARSQDHHTKDRLASPPSRRIVPVHFLARLGVTMALITETNEQPKPHGPPGSIACRGPIGRPQWRL